MSIVFSPEEKEMILSALEFTKEKIKQYHFDWANKAHQINQEEIRLSREKNEKAIMQIIEIMTNKGSKNTVTAILERLHVYKNIVSALNIYSQEMEKAIDPLLPVTEKRYKKIKNLLKNKKFSNIENNLYQKFYNGYSTTSNSNEKSLFFSYSTKDKQIIGKICKVLEDKYGFSVFRAHDDIEPSAIWREEIKKNLEDSD
jgi:hypothetical protein